MEDQRRFFFVDDRTFDLPLQKSITCLSVSAWIDATCRLAAAVAWPRADPSILFAELSHMLMNGFFVVQGLRIVSLSRPPLAATDAAS